MRPIPARSGTAPSTSARRRLRSGIVAAVCVALLAASLASATSAAAFPAVPAPAGPPVTPAAAAGASALSAPAAANTLRTLSRFQPDHFVQSTGNVYWTYNVGSSTGREYARVYRMSKQGTPGTERVLWELSGPSSPFYFRALTYAKVGTQFYGYFVVDNAQTHTSVIRRVSLAGGQAVTIVASPRYIGPRDLVTDGRFLFWADEGGLRRSTIGGAELTTLASGRRWGRSAST